MVNNLLKLFLSLLCISTLGLNAMAKPRIKHNASKPLVKKVLKKEAQKNLQALIQEIKAEVPGMLEKYFEVHDPYLFDNKKEYTKQLERKHGLENCILDEKQSFQQKQKSIVGLVDEYHNLIKEMNRFSKSVFAKEIFPCICQFKSSNKIIMYPQGQDLNPTSINRLIIFYEATNQVLKIIKKRLRGH